MIEYIPAALASINLGKEGVKLIIDSPNLLKKTEMEIQLASINRSLFEAETALLESQKLIKEKDAIIEELKNLIKFKANLIRYNGMYFESNEDGSLVDDPYCSNCWDDEKKAIHLKIIQPTFFECPKCKNRFGQIKRKTASKVIQSRKSFIKGWR